MALIRSLLFFLLFYPGTLVYVLTVIAVSPFGIGAGTQDGPRLVGLPLLAGPAHSPHSLRMGWRDPGRSLSDRGQAPGDGGSGRYAPLRPYPGGGDEA